MGQVLNEREECKGQWLTRERALLLVLLGVTLILLSLCYLLVAPFVPALCWALALAIVLHPVHQRVERRIGRPGLAAGLSAALGTIAVIAPLILVGNALLEESPKAFEEFQKVRQGRWRTAIDQNRTFGPILRRLESHVNVEQELQALGRSARSRLPEAVTGSLRAAAGVFITIFSLFFFLRDRRQALQVLRSLSPLSHAETDELFKLVSDTIYATLQGSIVVAAVQGAMGGLMFGILGLRAPVLWGFVMAVLATIPMLGTFVIWLPAAVFLIIEGSVWKGAILIVYGSCAIGLIDNFLYPYLVGSRMQLHTLPVFFALVGGVFQFGITGLVLGPVILSVAIGVLQVWKWRTADGRGAEKPQEPITVAHRNERLSRDDLLELRDV